MIFDIQSRLTPATMTRSDSGLTADDRIGRHHDRFVVIFGMQKIAEYEVARHVAPA